MREGDFLKAIVVKETGPYSVLQLQNLPIPEPKFNEVLIKVHACAVCYHDVVVRKGIFRQGVKLPLIPGHEIAGEIVRIGPSVKYFKIGDPVVSTIRSHICGNCNYCRIGKEMLCSRAIILGDTGLNGGYAQYAIAAEENLIKIPDSVSMDEAAIAPCAIGTQLNAIRDVGQALMGERVLITGSGGGVGLHGVQLAKLMGCHVIAVTTSDSKVKTISQAGANDVIVIEKSENFSNKVKEITNGEGVQLAIDNVGTPIFISVLKSLMPGGRWVLVGQLSGEFITFNPAQLFLKGINLLSTISATRSQVSEVLQMIKRGLIKPMISGTYPLEEAPRIHALMEKGKIIGRVILKPNL